MAIVKAACATQFRKIHNVLLCSAVKPWWYHPWPEKDSSIYHGETNDLQHMTHDLPNHDPQPTIIYPITTNYITSHFDKAVETPNHHAHALTLMMARFPAISSTRTPQPTIFFIHNIIMNLSMVKQHIFQWYIHPATLSLSQYQKWKSNMCLIFLENSNNDQKKIKKTAPSTTHTTVI